MTEDLIEMAAEAGFDELIADEVIKLTELERFAALIEARAVARTREECADFCDEIQPPSSCNTIERHLWNVATLACADAIRALGERT